MTGPTQEFWQERFASGVIPWDRGAPNPQLAQWITDGTLAPGSHVIVPGCGQGWEVAALAAAGMDVTGIDFTPGALTLCRQLLEQNGARARLVDADVLHWLPATPVDAVFEQTCLCALYPDFWTHYAAQLHAWLKPGGQLLALFMQAQRPESTLGFIEGPPYHCDIHAMRAIFPATQWAWQKPPYPCIENTRIERTELAVALVRK
ncbi:MAG: methyltransferase domain-containing protein [Gammaproteobacteria bacterium]|nr:methyltransferase domain-containing protein [Rhodocyclaceae bacterium]MBU3910754.1 methyltransferase domain-containing protein [Gammaproteobacteria bacterium]MBU3988919.1 methyltransferase domain-containing protein [Gammaproteobacteria bacterium]MBU4003464.1 methyltransferase domain-containing protein [Gammaproteobacteria bacterium]MBU4021935.1 methyltransferase domain-containing protein [Gammaproteobacteria bacterium]